MKKMILFSLAIFILLGWGSRLSASPTEEETKAALETLNRLMATYKTDDSGKIVFFDLTNQPCTNEDLEKLSKLSDVQECKIYGANLKPGGAAVIKRLTSCKKLSIENTDFVDEDMAVLAEMPWVEELTLRRNTYLGTETIKYISKLPKLRNLVLLYGIFGDDAIHELKEVKTLRLLDLRGCADITDNGLTVLKDLPNLIVLKIRCTSVTNNGIENIRGKKMRTFDIQDSQTFDDQGINILLDMGNSLTELTIMRCIAVSNDGIKKLSILKKIKKLNLRGNYINCDALEACQNMNDLELLCLSETYVGNAGMKFLENLKKLKTLDLWNTTVTDEGLDSIQKITSLNSLNLMGTQITDAGIKKLTGLTSLTTLNLDNTSITNEAVETLSQMKHLKKLSIKATMLTNAGIQKLKDSLPECVIEE
ncbi:MAG: hypothetical protein Q4C96_01650 [Planctomycetia bacterium]|nr:hypothetical protein [Planctomycetia bacterium]